MRDLDKALRMARKERDVSRAGREEALSAMEECKKEMGGMQNQLKEREKQCTLLERSCDKMKEEQEALTVRYVALEGSLNELQNVLAMVQSRSEKKAASMKEAMAEVEEREEKSVIEYQTLMKKYNEVQRQCGEMEGVLTDMTTRFEEVKADCVRKEEELEMVEAKLATFIEETRAQHESEMNKLQSAAREEARVLYEAMLTKNDSDYESAMKEIRMLHDRQLKEKDELLKAREKQWEAKTRDFNDQEIQALKVKMQQIERENEQLKTEKAELTRKLEKGVAIYNETTSQLKAKTAEAVAASSNKGCDAELIAANKALKKDLTSAVESSISRGRQIQALEKEIESYQLKLTKANQHMKRMEKALPGLTSDNEETRRLESEICNLRSRAEEAERDRHILQERVAALDIQAKHANQEKQQLASRLDNLRANAQETEQTISNMMEEITALSTKASQVQTLERNLTDARLALANSQSRILDLEEALQETEIALRTVSSARLRGNSPTSSPGKESVMECQESEMRRQIENMALKEYVGQRL
jgi:predicted  nucleic acid-binding Zn-ribbon protein